MCVVAPNQKIMIPFVTISHKRLFIKQVHICTYVQLVHVRTCMYKWQTRAASPQDKGKDLQTKINLRSLEVCTHKLHITSELGMNLK